MNVWCLTKVAGDLSMMWTFPSGSWRFVVVFQWFTLFLMMIMSFFEHVCCEHRSCRSWNAQRSRNLGFVQELLGRSSKSDFCSCLIMFVVGAAKCHSYKAKRVSPCHATVSSKWVWCLGYVSAMKLPTSPPQTALRPIKVFMKHAWDSWAFWSLLFCI